MSDHNTLCACCWFLSGCLRGLLESQVERHRQYTNQERRLAAATAQRFILLRTASVPQWPSSVQSRPSVRFPLLRHGTSRQPRGQRGGGADDGFARAGSWFRTPNDTLLSGICLLWEIRFSQEEHPVTCWRHYDRYVWITFIITPSALFCICANKPVLAATCDGSRPGVQSASLYDNFCKTGNDVIDDVIIWIQDGNCKKKLVLVRCTA